MAHLQRNFIFTSESVTEGHPDKVCDQISDAILDALLAKEAQLEEQGYVSPSGGAARVADVRCACETFATEGTVLVAGEIRCQSYVDIASIVRQTLERIGYTDPAFGIGASSCGIMNLVHGQSPDIALGVDAHEGEDPLDALGAGDQGIMFGYACNETKALMPMPIYLAHKLAQGLARLRHEGVLDYLRPDGKTQVSIGYEQGHPSAAKAIVVSAQHDPAIDDMRIIEEDLRRLLIAPVMEEAGIPWEGAAVHVNPTGRFTVGGPAGDTGLTGRKIVVDTYGGMGRHGGGCFSGKDATKVDRSGAYAARWVAKNIVAAGLADHCEVELAYAIGVAKPVSVMVDAHGTEKLPEEVIEKAVREVFDLRPAAIIRDLGLTRPIFAKTAAYGHFGREDADFTWERTDRVDALLEAAGRA